MATERHTRIAELLGAAAGRSLAERICVACVRAVSVSGAGMCVMGEDGQHGLAHGTDPTARELEEIQLTMGEGPCVDAFESRGPVLVPELGRTQRWPAFSSHAIASGVAAVFSLPLQVGAARLGVLDLYRTTAGPLSPGQLSDALVFADLATRALLVHDPAQPTGVSVSLDGVDTHAELYQASGMVMVQLGIGPVAALARIRAHAYAHDLLVTDVARQVISRQLRLEGDPT